MRTDQWDASGPTSSSWMTHPVKLSQWTHRSHHERLTRCRVECHEDPDHVVADHVVADHGPGGLCTGAARRSSLAGVSRDALPRRCGRGVDDRRRLRRNRVELATASRPCARTPGGGWRPERRRHPDRRCGRATSLNVSLEKAGDGAVVEDLAYSASDQRGDRQHGELVEQLVLADRQGVRDDHL